MLITVSNALLPGVEGDDFGLCTFECTSPPGLSEAAGIKPISFSLVPKDLQTQLPLNLG